MSEERMALNQKERDWLQCANSFLGSWIRQQLQFSAAFQPLTVELVGIEKLGILKTDKLLICREPYNAHKASNACNVGFIVRLLYGDSQPISRPGLIATFSRELRWSP
jgi:hypothetical protein